jgi:outer membrane protein assembly factor BamB
LTKRTRDIAAFGVAEDRGRGLWSFGLEGESSSPPFWDAIRKRIYFGNDNALFALDESGHPVWSFLTDGKVLARPVEVNGTVIFGSEDQAIYGLDAETGSAKWKLAAGAAVASAPAVAANLVVIGADDGTVRALDPQTAEEKWRYAGPAAIRTPMVSGQNAVYAATRGGDVVALDSKTGKMLWTTKLGGPLESAMAVGSDQLFVVESGRVTALALDSGKQIWQSPAEEYVGTPLIANGALIVALRQGRVRRLDFTGRIRDEWSAAINERQAEAVNFPFGPVSGGGALWLSDHRGATWRLGPVGHRPQRPDRPTSESGPFNAPVGLGR